MSKPAQTDQWWTRVLHSAGQPRPSGLEDELPAGIDESIYERALARAYLSELGKRPGKPS